MLAPLATCLTGRQVVPTYPLPVSYRQHGSGIGPHTDQPENEISLSYQLSLSPASAQWPLHLADAEPNPIPPGEPSLEVTWVRPKDMAANISVHLQDNDGVIYHGRDLVHWREPRPEGTDGVQQLIFSWRSVQRQTCAGPVALKLGRRREPFARKVRLRDPA